MRAKSRAPKPNCAGVYKPVVSDGTIINDTLCAIAEEYGWTISYAKNLNEYNFRKKHSDTSTSPQSPTSTPRRTRTVTSAWVSVQVYNDMKVRFRASNQSTLVVDFVEPNSIDRVNEFFRDLKYKS